MPMVSGLNTSRLKNLFLFALLEFRFHLKTEGRPNVSVHRYCLTSPKSKTYYCHILFEGSSPCDKDVPLQAAIAGHTQSKLGNPGEERRFTSNLFVS